MSHYINGQWITGNGIPFSSHDPAHNEIVWSGTSATEVEIQQAFHSAQKALPAWSLLELSQRVSILQKVAQHFQRRSDELSLMISRESGKPLWDSKTEVSAMIAKIDLTIQAHERRCLPFEQSQCLTRFKPHGITIVLGPFNFPGHLPNGQMVPALLEGNVVLFKPSEYTPGVAQLTVECWHEAGIPPGVLQLIQGERATGEILAQDPQVNALFFTGSSTVGQKLIESFSKKTDKILAVEMGGNNPLIVWNPTPLDAAVIGIIQSAFTSAGQRCNAARRLIIPRNSWGNQLLEKLVTQTQKLLVGSFRNEPEPFMGSLISSEAAKRVLKSQEQWIQQGAEPRLKLKNTKEGTGIVSPGVLLMPESFQEDIEVFAPLLQVYQVDTFEEALTRANQTKFGLAASLFCDEKEKFDLFWATLRAGIIHWNHPTITASGAAPFGGVGLSGNHRPAGFFMVDSCVYPVASFESPTITVPASLPPGIQ